MVFKTNEESVSALLLWANTFVESIVEEEPPLVAIAKTYEAFPITNLINIGAFRPTDEKMFKMFLRDMFGIEENSKIDFEFIIFLHEIGHIETNGVFSHQELEEYEKDIAKIEKRTDENRLLEYYDLNVEWTATKWAIDYLNGFSYLQAIELANEYMKLLNEMRKEITIE